MTARALDVYVSARRVGTLTQPEPARYLFSYEPGVSPSIAIALAMPVRAEPYEDTELFPIFAQQLPEPGSALFALIGTAFSKLVPLTTEFDWLKLIGPHLNNRVRVVPPGEAPVRNPKAAARLKDLDVNQDSQELFEEMFRRVGLAGAGVSGILPKLAIALKGMRLEERLTLGFDDDVIVKFAPAEGEYPGLLVNEYLCMDSARDAGITVPEIRLSDDGGRLVLKRFDRTVTGRAKGFEEAATVRFLSYRDKYSGSYEAMVREMLEFVTPRHQPAARIGLFKMIAHTLLTGNGDAHQKNFGVLYEDLDEVSLAPAYDLVSTLPYIPKDQPAVSFNGRKRWLGRSELLAFGEDTCGLMRAAAAEHLDMTAAAVERMRAKIPEYIVRFPQFRGPLGTFSEVLARRLAHSAYS